MPGPTAPSGDTIQATINVSVAQSRRLISSWLPPPTPEEIASQKTEEQLAKEDAELFRIMPPRLGLGAPIPKDFLERADTKARRQAISTNEHLKRKIMGRKNPPNKQEASKPRPRAIKGHSSTNDDEDEEEGRSSLGKPKRRKTVVEKKKETEKNDVDEVSDFGSKEGVGGDEKGPKPHSPSSNDETEKTSPKGPIRFGTYFDIHRTEKARRKRKKKRKPTN